MLNTDYMTDEHMECFAIDNNINVVIFTNSRRPPHIPIDLRVFRLICLSIYMLIRFDTVLLDIILI